MAANVYGKYFYYLTSVLFLVIGLFGINRLMLKADLPFLYSYQDNQLFSTEYYNGIQPGDDVLSVDGVKIKSLYHLETYLDSKSIGDDADLEIISGGNQQLINHVHLTRYYRNLNFIIVSLLVGISFWITAFFLIMKKYGEKSVTLLYWILLLFSLATMTSPGKYFYGNDFIAYIVRVSHVCSYLLGSVLLLRFTFTFPEVRIQNYKRLSAILYAIAFLICITLVILQLYSITVDSSEWVYIMEKFWIFSQIFILASIISSAINLYITYRKLKSIPEKKKTEWIFWGLAAGAGPFLLLWLVPRLLGFNEFIQEEYLLAFLILVPIFFAMAVVKYHVFEIEIFIKKSILYTLLTFIIIVFYFIIITAFAFFANDLMIEYGNLVSILLILLIAFIFNPLQNKMRNFTDKIFYREKYNFEKTVSAFTEKINNQNTVQSLCGFFINEVERIIPVKKIALVDTNNPASVVRILYQKNCDNIVKLCTDKDFSQFIIRQSKLTADKEKIEPGLDAGIDHSGVLEKWGINILIPFRFEPENYTVAFLVGDKLSGLRFNINDIEILNVLTSNMALAFKKLQYQEKLLFEEMENTRLDELNKMMTYYVSSVSHDLKTPLTSIKMFTEILKEQSNYKNENSSEYLDIIEGESDRLSRLINNVLSFAKMEKGLKEYSFGKINLNECIEDVLKILEYQIKMDNFIVIKSLQENITITADKDAVTEVLINIISNALKYSPERKYIRISAGIENDYAVVKIEDEGIGISQDDLKDIFKPFIRLKHSNINHTGGAGIGLSIVKNIMEAHKGKIEVKSILGKGSCFILYFRLTEFE